ncbi:MAG: hypothetical protein JWR53_1818 [Glaciihabitans sp.]|jgi:Tfp pilus assembly protein PilN|nr:hypothetical protein [Glaciihabitans sp.]MCU1535337.1 hypothetical protein [Glaciihabitans sp.]
MSNKIPKGETLVVGGSPRVHLLPPEVSQKKRSRQLQSRLGLGVVAVLAVAALAVAGAYLATLNAQTGLLSAQSASASIAVQQRKYVAVTQVETDVAAIKKAQIRATAKEIAWAPYIDKLSGTLTEGMKIVSLEAGIDGAFLPSTTVTVPLEGPRIASLKVTVTTPQKSIATWLDNLTSLPGFVDATPGSVDQDKGSSYKVVVDLHINDAALANRFPAPKAG